MKTKILIMCAVLSLGLGCKKETEQVDRYKVFPATWEESALSTSSSGEKNISTYEQKKLVKVDSVTGRVWLWNCSTEDPKVRAGWVEMTDSGYVMPLSLQNQTK